MQLTYKIDSYYSQILYLQINVLAKMYTLT